MTVQDTAVPVAVPTQGAQSVDAVPAPLPAPLPVTAEAPPSAPLLGRDRALTTDERQFAVGLAVLTLVLGTIIVVGLLVGQYVWS